MKFTIECLFVILAITIGITLISCNKLEQTKVQTKDSFENKKPLPQIIPTIKQDNEILSKDYNIAEKALSKAVKEKDKHTIRLGLKNPILTIRLKTVEAIKESDDKTFFVGDLIDALSENQLILEGGTETKIFQKELDRNIVSALEILTGLNFPRIENLSSKDIEKILKESREWLESNKSKN